MQHVEPNSIEFKYKWFDESGTITGFKSGKGSYNGSTLKIGDLVVDVADLISLNVSDSVFLFGILNDSGEIDPLNIEIFGTDIQRLENALNAGRSRAIASHERERLTETGQLQTYRDAICPFCKSTIVLSGLPQTEQIYCEYCDTLYSSDRREIGDVERHFRICEGCGMYSRPRQFAVFYFYFLVVTFGLHHTTANRCSGCMRYSAWKMLFGNLLGLLGFPFALMQLYRAYSTQKLTGVFQGLDDANVLARRGKLDFALEKYDTIMDSVPENAGVKFNIASGLMLKRDFAHAEKMFELSLDDCSNYWPSLNGLMMSLRQQKKMKELAAVQKLWGSVGSPDIG